MRNSTYWWEVSILARSRDRALHDDDDDDDEPKKKFQSSPGHVTGRCS